MNLEDKIYVSGHRGLLGSSLVRTLRENGYRNLVLKTSGELNLTDQNQVSNFFRLEKPDYVFLGAGRCGGIKANDETPVPFIQENLEIQNNVIKNSHIHKVKKLLFVGSAAAYPKDCEQPIKESDFLNGSLDEINSFYSIAKISGVKLCQAYKKQYGDNFISVQPANIYGPKDKFNRETGHVVAALISKFHEAKVKRTGSVSCWGTGNARREFIYVDDLSDALVFLMQNYDDYETINIGIGKDHSMKDLVNCISDTVEYDGDIVWDTEKPEGRKQRLLDSSKLFSLGWFPKYSLEDGIKLTYNYYKLEKK